MFISVLNSKSYEPDLYFVYRASLQQQ